MDNTKLMTSFHPGIYLALNPDLVPSITPQQASKHYMECGQKEGRKTHIKQLYPDFRYNIYLSLNADLSKHKLSEIDAQLHWLQKGRFENRLYKPVMQKDPIILYTDGANKKRCKDFGTCLEKIGIPYEIKEDGMLQTNHLYILFSLYNIKTFPFYFMLYLTDYKINVSIIELAMGICASPAQNVKQTGKLFYIEDSDYSTEELLKRILTSIGFLQIDNYNVPLDASKINLVYSPEDTQAFEAHPKIQMVYSIKSTRGEDVTIQRLIVKAKEQNLPYVMISKEYISPSNQDLSILAKTICFLEEMNISWDIITHVEKIDAITHMIEIIQVDRDTEMIRSSRYTDSTFYVINKKLYDYVLKWNKSGSLNKHLKQNEIHQISVKNVFVKTS